MQNELVGVVLTIALTVATSIPLGRYMARVFSGESTWLDPVFLPVERLVLRLTGVSADEQQDWKAYSISLLVSNVFMWLVTLAVVTLQGVLFLNPDG
ncbi:MAG TPA: potassium-transporting ATPase subunit KdpA, partial [Candidatus Polarisedimenticolaceae bacterium]|nr:potassium-transporting ATPase subunit KdpA [Candidatus Polarisedimenticolaceae bacterium]